VIPPQDWVEVGRCGSKLLVGNPLDGEDVRELDVSILHREHHVVIFLRGRPILEVEGSQILHVSDFLISDDEALCHGAYLQEHGCRSVESFDQQVCQGRGIFREAGVGKRELLILVAKQRVESMAIVPKTVDEARSCHSVVM